MKTSVAAAVTVLLFVGACWDPAPLPPADDADPGSTSADGASTSEGAEGAPSSSTTGAEPQPEEGSESETGDPNPAASSSSGGEDESSTGEALDVPFCGDGVVNSDDEQCDDGNDDDADACPSTCLPARCGDGFVLEGVEACDDGNTVPGDGCPAACTIPAGCEGDTDPLTGFPWTVCGADETAAWLSSEGWGQYHALAICQSLGYAGVAAWGSNCGNTCGSCDAPSSCDSPGAPVFDGTGDCGDGPGEVLCGDGATWVCM